jgi:iron complex outermembrane receptor protein
MDLKNRPGSSDANTIRTDEGSSPRHELSLQSRINLPKSFEFDPTYRYVGRLPGQLVKSYSTMDARLGWRFAGRFELSFVGQNLFQPSHSEFGGDPGGLLGVKRSAYVKMLWTSDTDKH